MKITPTKLILRIRASLANCMPIRDALAKEGFELGKTAYIKANSLYLRKGRFGSTLVCTLPYTGEDNK